MKNKITRLWLCAIMVCMSIGMSAQTWTAPTLDYPFEGDEPLSGESYVLFNTKAGLFLTGTGYWGVQTALVTEKEGTVYPSVFQLSYNEEEDGWTFLQTSNIIRRNNTPCVNTYMFRLNENSSYFDMGSQGDNYWALRPQDNNVYRIQTNELNGVYGRDALDCVEERDYDKEFLGWTGSTSDMLIYPNIDPDDEGVGVDWLIIQNGKYSTEEIEDYLNVTYALYAVKVALFNLAKTIVDEEYSIDYSPYTEAYEGNDINLVNGAISELENLIWQARVNKIFRYGEDGVNPPSDENPAIGTSLIKNATFDKGESGKMPDYWTTTFVYGTSGLYVGYQAGPPGGYTNGDVSINKFIEAWANSIMNPNCTWVSLCDGELSQTLKNLPAGKYMLACDAIASSQGDNPVSGVQLFATGGGTDTYENIATGTGLPEHFELNFSSTGGDITIGLRTNDCTARWIAADNFTLTYYGDGIIDFADANVKALCVANWDTDGDGELSEEEAAAVTSLGEVFLGNKKITSFDELQYFTGLTTIGESAFSYCSSLTSVTIPNNAISIGRCVFWECSGLTSVTIPNSVTSIGASAFGYCSGLTSVTIPNSVTSIGSHAFWGCSGLASVNIPNSVTSIGESAFINCSALTSVTIPNSVTTIAYLLFNGCSSLTSVTIPESVTSIGQYAFGGCSALESIIVEAGNTLYDSRENCNAIIETASNTLIAGCKNTNIPNSVTSIGSDAFGGCSGLSSVTIPNSVISIGSDAFSGCSGLTSVTIPNSVTSIEYNTFAYCNGLESIIVEAGNTVYDSREDCNAVIETASNTLIAGCKNTVIPNSVTSIGSYAFWGCSGLSSVTIPNSVTSIGSDAFTDCSGLASITIPEGLTTIGDWAFNSCLALNSITIPNSVTSIGEWTFSWCTGLTDVYCYATDIPNTKTDAFENSPISSVTLHVPAGSIADYAATEPWSGFGTIVPIISSTTLADGESYTNDMDTEYDEITYTRNFNNTNWQALYVPFEMQYDDWKNDFEVARINNMNQYDDNEDGTIDRTVMEVIKVKSGGTAANMPYLIKAKTTGEKTITLTDATLYAAEDVSHDVSSWNTLFTFTGTYSGISGATMFGNGYYALGNGTLHQAADATNALSPMRWYMAVTDRNGNPKDIGEVKVMVFGEDETDGLTPIDNGKWIMDNKAGAVYDLSGRRVTNPRSGIYVKNGRKVVIK